MAPGDDEVEPAAVSLAAEPAGDGATLVEGAAVGEAGAVSTLGVGEAAPEAGVDSTTGEGIVGRATGDKKGRLAGAAAGSRNKESVSRRREGASAASEGAVDGGT